MRPVITGMIKISSDDIEYAMTRAKDMVRQMRFVNSLVQLTVASIGIMLDEAKINIPVGNNDISLFLGVDDSVEDIKDEYFNGILKEGVLGASPSLFPYTTPNSLAAQVTIAFDIRGESITVPIKNTHRNVMEYAVECIDGKYTSMAIAGGIRLKDKNLTIKDGRYMAEFFLLEEAGNAEKRGAKIYNYSWE